MKTLLTAIFSTLAFIAFAQTGNFGIGTATPGSKLTVNGSFGLGYNSITTSSYAMTASDYHVGWNGATPGTITLPAAINGTGNFKGRLYSIKNTSASLNLTVMANGAELVNSVGATNVTSISLGSGQSLQLISNGNTSGTTWEVVSFSSTTAAATVWTSSGNDIYNNNTGNAGIGTTNPATHLHVAGKGDQEISLESTTALTDGAEYPGRRWSLQSNPGGDIQATFQIIDRQAGQPRLAINNSGNVGLGTTEPEARLDVIGSTKTTSLQVTTGAGEGYVLKSDVDGHANWVAPGSLGIGTWIANGDNQYSSLGGNVGLGTNNPATHLHVAGKGDQEISLESTTALTDGAEYAGRRWSLQSNPGGDIQATFQIIDRQAGQPRLAINNSGNVGLGTTEPEARLDVNGATKTTSLQITAGAGDGYVLKSDADGNAAWSATSYTEADPKVGTLSSNAVPKWDGTTLVNGLTTDDGSNLSTRLSLSGKMTVSALTAGTEPATIINNTVDGTAMTSSDPQWQSFSAVSTFSLSAIKASIYLDIFEFSTTKTLRLYSGEGTAGTLIATSSTTYYAFSLLNQFEFNNIVITPGIYTIEITDGSKWALAPSDSYAGGRSSVSPGADFSFSIIATSPQTKTMLSVAGAGVGIGTASPAALLDVNGTAKTTRLQVTNGAAEGYLLVSDASGNASWSPKSNIGISDLGGSLNGDIGGPAGANYIGAGKITTAHIADGNITDSKLATIISAGKVANSATTGTSANTASTLVLRDGAGNFSAGTITAASLKMTTGATNSYVLTSDASGNASWAAPSADNLGNHTATQSLNLNSNSLLLVGADVNHGLGMYGTGRPLGLWDGFNVVGPVLYGFAGGVLGSTNGGQKSVLTWRTNGNVGIGTTDPQTKLHIAGTGDQEISIESTTTGTFNGHRWTLQSNTPAVGLNASFQIIDRTVGSSRFAIDQTGNVGIGTTNPASKLEVNGTTKTTNLQVTNGAGTGMVLTSDATGNATWQTPQRVAFMARQTTNISAPGSTSTNVPFNNEIFDDVNGTPANNFNNATGVFTVPASGIYHFDAAIGWSSSAASGERGLELIVNGVNTNGAASFEQPGGIVHVATSITLKLNANDLVQIRVVCFTSIPQTVWGLAQYSYFSGYKVN